MNHCTDVRALLPLMVGGDLEEGQALAVAEHLAGGCGSCSTALRELERVRGFLRELPKLAPAPAVELWPDLRAALLSEGLLRRGPIVVRRARVGAGGMWLSAAAAALLVGGALWSLRPGESAREVQQVAPEVAGGGAMPGVTPVFAPTLVGGPANGGLRPLDPGEAPFSLEAELFGVRGTGVPLHPRGLQPDPARPTLAGDRGN